MRKSFDVNQYRQDFPILKQAVNGKPLVYLDNSATTQKPRCVMDAVNYYYEHDNANVHRGVHTLGARTTLAFEAAREKVREFINAKFVHEIIFVRGTTEAINLVAQTLSRNYFNKGDEILISAMEHHANIVPWQMVCEQTGAVLKVLPVTDQGEIDLDNYDEMLTDKTKFVAITHISNVLGTINPVKKMIVKAHAKNIPVLVDGAQAIAHMPIDVQDLDADFYAFSGHKLYGPTGIGVLYGKTKWLEQMPPYEGGGSMIAKVTFAKTEYQQLPYKFEAGTANIAGIIGLRAAIDYLQSIGMQRIAAREAELTETAYKKLTQIPALKILGNANKRAGVFSFVFNDIHAHDIATIVDSEGVAIRAGHHCAMPLLERFKVTATARASLGLYNTEAEIDTLVAAIHKAIEVFK